MEDKIMNSDEELREVFTQRLKRLRMDKDLTLEELAKILKTKYDIGVTYGSLGNYERNTRMPSLFILSKIAEFFDVTTDYLLGKVDIKNAKIMQTTIFDKYNKQQNVKLVVNKDSELANMSINEIRELVIKLRSLGIDFDNIV
ncbi:MAG TPA: helix-turn-helix transcriptional regulator [Clostridiaceae bacterium]